jgi:hypothetical protein
VRKLVPLRKSEITVEKCAGGPGAVGHDAAKSCDGTTITAGSADFIAYFPVVHRSFGVILAEPLLDLSVGEKLGRGKKLGGGASACFRHPKAR